MKENNKVLMCVGHGCKNIQGSNGEYCEGCFKNLGKIKYQSITIPMSESDCQDIMNGTNFDWVFETEKGVPINVHIKLETNCNECGDDSDDLDEYGVCINCRE